MTLGKPFGNGHPLAAVVTTIDLAKSFENGMEYFNTFGGNPVSCAVGLAVLDVIEDQGLQQHALDVGQYLQTKLRQLATKFPTMADIRGRGLFLGIEFVVDRTTKEPASDLAKAIVELMKAKRILVTTEGPFNSMIKLKPPMVFSHANADEFVAALEECLEELR